MSQGYTTAPATPAMQPAAITPCAYNTDDYVDFESAHQFSITSEDWTLTELDEAAMGIEHRTIGVGGVKAKPEVKKSAQAVTSSVVSRSSMKASMLDNGDDDLFSGTTRNYGSAFNKSRPTMISAKYRLKEERRKVLKISINKLKKIEDPESSLRRSILINNTMKRLQKEAREERREKQQIHSFPRYTPSYKSFVLREEPPKPVEDQVKPAEVNPRLKPDANKENASPFPSERKHSSKSSLDSCFCDETLDELVDVTSLDEELSRPLEELADPVNMMETASAVIDDVAARCSSRKRSFDEDVGRPLEALSSLMEAALDDERSPMDTDDCDRVRATRKRSYEEVEDSEIHDVLSQFYMPPTPRMLTSIDEDEDEEVNVVDVEVGMESSPIVTKVLGFEELVRDELDDEMLGVNVKRARFDSPTLNQPLVFEATTAFTNSSCDLKTPSFGFMDVVTTTTTTSTRTCCDEEKDRDVGSVNCGTVSTSLTSTSNVECVVPCAARQSDVKEVKNIDFTTKENKAYDRRAQITRLSDAVSWTTRLNETRTEDYKYNKALSDCCYNQENSNNMAADTSKFSCAHAAITELQSQVYHNYVTSLES